MVATLRARSFAPAGVWGAVVFASVAIGTGVAGTNPIARTFLSLLVPLSVLVLLLALTAESVFFGWFALAPLLQEAFVSAGLGSRLNLPLYQAPPLILLLITLARRNRKGRGSWFDVLPAVYLAYLALRLSLSHWVDHDVTAFRSLYYTVGIGIALYYICAFSPGRFRPERVARLFLSSGVLVASFTVAQGLIKRSPWADNGWTMDGRVVGPLQNPAVLGTFLGVIFVLAVAIWVWDAPSSLRRLALVAGILAAAGTALTYTRGSILAALAVGALIPLMRLKSRLMAVGVIICVGLLIAASWGKITTTATYRDRLANTSNVEARVLIQDWSIELAKRRPIAGWGYGSFDDVKNSSEFGTSHGIPVRFGKENTSHNTFLTTLVEEGILGLGFLLVPLGIICFKVGSFAASRPRHRWYLIGLLGGIGVYVLNAVTIDMRFFSFVPAMVWVLAGLGRRFTLSGEG